MTKIVLIGAGSTIFGLGTISDIFNSSTLNDSTVVLCDIDDKALAKTKKLADEYKSQLCINVTIEATTDRKEALKGANFCIISIEVGDRFKLWEQDWQIPLQFGFKQIYGENGGPGGLFHSLRIIPEVLTICEDIYTTCPEAFVFNYSNPMQRICHAVNTKYPDLNFTGLCHEIYSMKRQLPELMGTSYSNIEFKAGGLNHLSVLTDVKYADTQKDGYPVIHKNFARYYRNYINRYDDWHISKPGGERGVFFELYKQYQLLPITTDSHLGEYIQWAHSVADHDGILEFYNNYKTKCMSSAQNVTSVSEILDPKKEKLERVVPIIEAIIEDKELIEAAVNIPNRNFIDILPNDIVVEVPAIINGNGISGTKIDLYPSAFGLLLNNQVGTVKLTTEAVINKSRHSAYLALLTDPVVDNYQSAEKLLNTMLDIQSTYLGYLS